MLDDRDVLALGWREVRQLRGEEIAYVPQDPASALNPSIRIGRQLVELFELRDIGTPQERDERSRAGLAEVGSAQRRRVPAPLPAPAVRRPGAAGGARDGVPAPAQGAGAGRADDRARRHHPGHGAGDDGRALSRPSGRGAVRHPRPRGHRQHRRPGRGDVRRSRHRARPAGRDLPRTVAPVHAGPAGRDPAPQAGKGTERHPGPHAWSGQPPEGLQVPRPVRLRAGPLQGDRATAGRGGPGPHRPLPAGRRDRQLGHQPRHGAGHRSRRRPGT